MVFGNGFDFGEYSQNVEELFATVLRDLSRQEHLHKSYYQEGKSIHLNVDQLDSNENRAVILDMCLQLQKRRVESGYKDAREMELLIQDLGDKQMDLIKKMEGFVDEIVAEGGNESLENDVVDGVNEFLNGRLSTMERQIASLERDLIRTDRQLYSEAKLLEMLERYVAEHRKNVAMVADMDTRKSEPGPFPLSNLKNFDLYKLVCPQIVRIGVRKGPAAADRRFMGSPRFSAGHRRPGMGLS